jgi:hypothetical protein
MHFQKLRSVLKKKFQKHRLLKIIGLITLIVGGIIIIPSIPSIYVWGKTLHNAREGERNYEFNGTISREVLESYLSRSITYTQLLHKKSLEGDWIKGDVNDSVRCLINMGAKFIGRTIFRWGAEGDLPNILDDAKEIADQIHSIDSKIILQACFFEIVTRSVESLLIPAWVFEEFGLTHEVRNFSFSDMYDVGGPHENYWGDNRTVPDMGKLETRMWAFYLVATYINLGIEAIHFGQVSLMSNNDPNHIHWRDLLQRVRAYAKIHARRNMVICDAHTPGGGYCYKGQLMFDFHSFPLRVEEVADDPYKGQLIVGHGTSIYTKSKGGITPSGWACNSLPYLVEFDNFGISNSPGKNIGAHWIWGYDEITWYANQDEKYRNDWLLYAVEWLEENDPNGFLQMPGSRPLTKPTTVQNWYFANNQTGIMPNGFNQEDTIKEIWEDMPNFYHN